MKKFLALLLSVTLLLSVGAYACAAEDEAADHSHTLSDVYIVSDGQVIDLSHVSVTLDVSADGKSDAGLLHIDVDGQTVGEIGVTAANGLLVLHLRSETLGHEDFAVDPVVVLANVMQSGIDSLIELLESIDTTDVARSIVDSFLAPGPVQRETITVIETPEGDEEPAGEEEPAEDAPEAAVIIPEITVEGDIAEVIAGCVSEPETVHMGGMEYDPNGGTFELPEDDYQMRTLTVDLETICQILDMVRVDGEPLGMGDELRQSGIEYAVNGVFYTGETASTGQVNITSADAESTYSVGAGYNQLVTETGVTTSYSFGLAEGDDPETMTGTAISFTVTESALDGMIFGPDSIVPEGLTVLSDMDAEQAFEVLGEALSTLLADVVTPVLQPVMTAMMADME